MRKTILYGLVTCAVWAWGAAAARADRLELLNGESFHGAILEQDNQRVRLRTDDGTVVVFRMTDVAKVVHETAQPAPQAPVQTTVIRTYAPVVEQHSIGYKDPRTAFHLSCFFPGGGQFYVGDMGKGMAQLGLFIGGIALAIASAPEYTDVDYYDGYGWYIGTERTRTGGDDGACAAGIVLALGTWIWSALDAPITAENYNRQHGLSLYDDPLKNRSLAVEPVMFGGEKKDASGMQVAFRF